MCGIAGTFNLNIDIEQLLNSQVSRGPDVKAHCPITVTPESKLYLGHNRLKIICLSDDANQPFTDSNRTHYLSFNGELYNYLSLREELEKEGVQFTTSSDTEVLLKSVMVWGLDALNKLNGMFAFAYYNDHSKKLYLVRDRFGVKPLYFYHQGNSLCFASTSKAIATHLQLKPNFLYLNRGLQYGIYEDGTGDSVYDNLQSVESGTFVEFDLVNHCQSHTKRYYDLSSQVANLQSELTDKSESELESLVLDTLQNACKLRLQADVPIAIALSGGLDSSAVAALSKLECRQIHAFSFGSPTDKKSEGPLVHLFSQHQSIDTQFVQADESDWMNAFWQTLEHQDSPFAGLSIVAQYLLYQKINQFGYKVVLGGQGGDEAFLGYRKFQLFFLKELIAKKKWLQFLTFSSYFTQMLWAERSRLAMFWQMKSKYNRKTGQQFNLTLPGESALLHMGSNDALIPRQIDDVLKYSLPTLLRYEDRNSMAHSIESRLPFMDYRLVELGCSLPVNMKLHRGYGKWVIRKVMKNSIPNAIRLAKYKRGFDVNNTVTVYRMLIPEIQLNLNRNKDIYHNFLKTDNLCEYFSEENLVKYAYRFRELTTLLWLGALYG